MSTRLSTVPAPEPGEPAADPPLGLYASPGWRASTPDPNGLAILITARIAAIPIPRPSSYDAREYAGWHFLVRYAQYWLACDIACPVAERARRLLTAYRMYQDRLLDLEFVLEG